MNNPKISDCLWKHFSFIGNQGHRINVLPPKGSLGASICRHPKLRTVCAVLEMGVSNNQKWGPPQYFWMKGRDWIIRQAVKHLTPEALAEALR